MQTKTFEMDGRAYTTDAETLEAMQSVRNSPDALAAIMHLGTKAGRIAEATD